LKSNVSDHLEMVTAVYKDAVAKCIADVSDLRDLKTIKSRVKEEGVSFLTITLPKFCQDFERSLALGHIDSTCFRNFRKYGSIPAFLRGMISQIFDRETGRILDESITTHFSERSVIIDGIRQICLTFKKTELDCSPERVEQAMANFIEVEQNFKSLSVPKEDQEYFSLVSSVLWDNMLGDLRFDMLFPRHGPGATAERISGNRKYVWRQWYDRIEPYFPIIDNGYSCSVIDSDTFDLVTIVPEAEELPVRVTPVPKTLKGPRIIAIEPVCMQYAQQAIQQYLYDTIESSRLTKGHINFRDQSVNQKLALMSSMTGQFATIDLSDASDRVPRDLALKMFDGHPDLRDAIDACRSRSAEMPSGEIISPLFKFASMGSALCFPVESMYFYTICVGALLKIHNLPVSHANCFKVSRDVYVYGDDIIVPSTNAIDVLDYLQKYNCKVNMSKTFYSGNFRESCGQDAFNGESVTPIYLRKERPKNMQQASELVSWVSTANAFYIKGYWRVATFMFEQCERILGPLPYVSSTSPGLGRVSMLGYRSVERWNKKTQCFEVKAWVPSPVYRSDSIDGYSALQKSLSRLEAKAKTERTQKESQLLWQKGLIPIDINDPLHLERTALHGAVALKRRWVPSQ